MSETGCTACGKAMPREEGNRLFIGFGGGYGEFIDPIDRPTTAILCGECAHAFVAATPWAARAMQLDAKDISGHNTGCPCWEGSAAQRRFDDVALRSGIWPNPLGWASNVTLRNNAGPQRRHLFDGETLESPCRRCGEPYETTDERHDHGKVWAFNEGRISIRPYTQRDYEQETAST